MEFNPSVVFNKENDSDLHMIPVSVEDSKESLMDKIIKIVKKLFNK